MPLTKGEVGFIFLLLLISFLFYLAYRIHVYRKIRDQEKVYNELWRKYYGKNFENKKISKQSKKSKKKGR